MKKNIVDFEKNKEYLICVDSDGCAMDTMDVKHEKCFGPKAVEVWGLQNIESRFLEVWNRVNLYTQTRGINRFKGLVLTFELVKEEGLEIPSLSSVKQWVETTSELSNPSLIKEIERTNDEQLKNTLKWSNEVNKAIAQLSGEDVPFPYANEGLAAVKEVADIAIVSSANGEAVCDEWSRHGLASHVQILLGQEAGTKAACIGQLKEYGYNQTSILMVGDSKGDLEAAQKNGALFYPILVGKEEFSWKRLADEGVNKLVGGTFEGDYQQKLIDEFYEILQ